MFVMLIFSLLFSTSCYCSSNVDPAIDQLKLKITVAQLATRDQTIRNEIMKYGDKNQMQSSLLKVLATIDQKNLTILKQLVPRLKLIAFQQDRQFLQNLWLLVQHADSDPDFQQKMLGEFALLAQIQSSERKHFAYLYDRVQKNRQQPQRYGTQGLCIARGQWVPFELQNTHKVDSYRASVGLGTFISYRTLMNHLCN